MLGGPRRMCYIFWSLVGSLAGVVDSLGVTNQPGPQMGGWMFLEDV